MIQVCFDRSVQSKWTAALAEHEQSYLKENELKLPGTDTIERNPEDYPNPAMWRDTVRRQLRFAHLRVNFRTIMVRGHPEVCVFSAAQPENVRPWAAIIQHLRDMETVCFDYTLQVVDVDNDYEYEYDGPPLALVDDVEISAENDVNRLGGFHGRRACRQVSERNHIYGSRKRRKRTRTRTGTSEKVKDLRDREKMGLVYATRRKLIPIKRMATD